MTGQRYCSPAQHAPPSHERLRVANILRFHSMDTAPRARHLPRHQQRGESRGDAVHRCRQHRHRAAAAWRQAHGCYCAQRAQHSAAQRSAQRIATQRSAMQRSATQRNTTQRNATQRNATPRNATQRNATEVVNVCTLIFNLCANCCSPSTPQPPYHPKRGLIGIV